MWHDPTARIELPAPPQRLPRVLSETQVEALLAAPATDISVGPAASSATASGVHGGHASTAMMAAMCPHTNRRRLGEQPFDGVVPEDVVTDIVVTDIVAHLNIVSSPARLPKINFALKVAHGQVEFHPANL